MSDVLAQPRRALPWLALLAVIFSSPNAREALAAFIRRLLASLRVSRFLRPPVRKDFLGTGDSQVAVRQGASKWQASSASAPVRSGPRTAGGVGQSGQGSFGEFGHVLPTWLSEGLRREGFQSLKPIQRKILPLALAGRDVCGIAPTGSGKTLAFLVPGLVHTAGQIAPRCPADGPIMLVLAPTRELAVQIGKVAEGLLKPSWDNRQSAGWGAGAQKSGGLNHAVLYGGARRSDQLQSLRFQQCTHLVVATPGRLLDFLEHGAFTLHRVSFFVLDEGDRMLDFGFEPDVTAIARQIRSDRQMLFFSATWPPEVEEAALRLCHKGQSFETVSAQPDEQDDSGNSGDNVNSRRITLPGHAGLSLPPPEILQTVEVVSGYGSGWDHRDDLERKMPLLLKHLEAALGGEIGETPGKALIFVGTRMAADEIGQMVARHFGLDRCGVMHGARKQDQREATLQAFRTGRLRALVATDVLGRGVDIPDVSHVVIYDFPGDIETYIHRVGRTGRNGQPGTAISFFEPRPWSPDIAQELVQVLRACRQEVPQALDKEAGTAQTSWDNSAQSPSGEGGWGAWNSPKLEVAQSWPVGDASTWRTAPPLESDSTELATAQELGEWHADGARVWGYSANAGKTEQGRLELRSEGKLRTTWGWGEWALLPSAPHCPPPSRRCPPRAETGGEPLPTPGTGEAGGAEASVAKEVKEDKAAGWVSSKPESAAPLLSLSWGGCTDVVSLDSTGLGFELVSRSGRAASTYKSKTLGRALPGVTL